MVGCPLSLPSALLLVSFLAIKLPLRLILQDCGTFLFAHFFAVIVDISHLDCFVTATLSHTPA